MEHYFERGQQQIALELALGRLEKNPDDLVSRIVICRALIAREQIEEASKTLEEIEGMLFPLPRLFAQMGELYKKKGLEGKAVRFYQKSNVLESLAALSPQPAEATHAVEEGFDFEGNQDGQNENVELPPDFETVTLAELYIRQGHHQMAEDLLLKIIRRDPANDRALRLLEDVRSYLALQQNPLPKGEIIKTLSQWLENIGRLKGNAG